MIKIVPYSPEYRLSWNNFVASAKNGLFMFDRNFMEYHKDRFEDCSLLFFEDDELLALLPANRSGDTLVSHGGLTYGGFVSGGRMTQVRMDACLGELKNWCIAQNIRTIIYKAVPYIYFSQPAQEDLYALYKCGAVLEKIEASTVINLQNPLKMESRRARMIKKAQKSGVEVRESTDFETFIELQNFVLEKYHGARAVHTGSELSLLHSRFPNSIRLLAAFLDEKMVAGTVLFEYANLVHTQYLASDDEGRKIGALDAVVDAVIKRYAGKKFWLDFGKSTEGDGKILNEGLISQKEGFGGRTVAYQTWKMIC